MRYNISQSTKAGKASKREEEQETNEDRREREENEEIIGMCGLGKKVKWKSLKVFSFPTGHIQQFPQRHLSFPDFSLYIVEAIYATNGWVKLQDQSLGMLT